MEAQMARKIKAAIKAKLIDLEAYVDDELSDYIMVMVANKKTQAQMSTDLALFLGDDANKFAAWLQRVLKKLQSITAERQRNNNNPESEDYLKGQGNGQDTTLEPKAKPPSDVRESTPPKKIAISFKKKIDLKSKVGGGNTPLESSPVASPRPHDSAPNACAAGSAAGSPVSSASLNSPVQRRSPSPNVNKSATSSTRDHKKRKSKEDQKSDPAASKGIETKRKKGAEEERKEKKGASVVKRKKTMNKQRQKDVEDKETQIVIIMKQIQRLKQKLMEEEASGSDDEEDEQQQVGDLVRAKIASLRVRLESIQEELNGEEEEEEQDVEDDDDDDNGKEIAKNEDSAKMENIISDESRDQPELSCQEKTDAENEQKGNLDSVVDGVQSTRVEPCLNGDNFKRVDSMDGLGGVATNEDVVKTTETNNSDIDSRCTTPLMDELPSPGAGLNSNDAYTDEDRGKTVTDEISKISPSRQSVDLPLNPIESTPDFTCHLPAFLSNSSEWRRCAECGIEEKIDVVCLECKAALHCQSSANCFRTWHLNKKTAADVPDGLGFELATVSSDM